MKNNKKLQLATVENKASKPQEVHINDSGSFISGDRNHGQILTGRVLQFIRTRRHQSIDCSSPDGLRPLVPYLSEDCLTCIESNKNRCREDKSLVLLLSDCSIVEVLLNGRLRDAVRQYAIKAEGIVKAEGVELVDVVVSLHSRKINSGWTIDYPDNHQGSFLSSPASSAQRALAAPYALVEEIHQQELMEIAAYIPAAVEEKVSI